MEEEKNSIESQIPGLKNYPPPMERTVAQNPKTKTI
jgi:hypothetical protein